MPPWTASLAPLDAQLRSGQLSLDAAVRDTPSLPEPPPEHELIAALQDRGGRVMPVLLLACCLRNHNRPLLYWLQQLLAPALALSQAEVVALLRLELCCRDAASDVSLLPDYPAAWSSVSWARPGGSCVVSRGHAMRVERLRPKPRMALVHGFLSPEECATVIGRARGHMAPSVVVRSEEALTLTLTPTLTLTLALTLTLTLALTLTLTLTLALALALSLIRSSRAATRSSPAKKRVGRYSRGRLE